MVYDQNIVDGCEILHQLIDRKHPVYPIIYRLSTKLYIRSMIPQN